MVLLGFRLIEGMGMRRTGVALLSLVSDWASLIVMKRGSR